MVAAIVSDTAKLSGMLRVIRSVLAGCARRVALQRVVLNSCVLRVTCGVFRVLKLVAVRVRHVVLVHQPCVACYAC